jgi:hypothetical protein
MLTFRGYVGLLALVNTMIVATKNATLRRLQQAWPDALFGGMILASLVGMIYLFTRR